MYKFLAVIWKSAYFCINIGDQYKILLEIIIIHVYNIQQRITIWLYLYGEPSLFLLFLDESLGVKLQVKLNDIISSLLIENFRLVFYFWIRVCFRVGFGIVDYDLIFFSDFKTNFLLINIVCFRKTQ